MSRRSRSAGSAVRMMQARSSLDCDGRPYGQRGQQPRRYQQQIVRVITHSVARDLITCRTWYSRSSMVVKVSLESGSQAFGTVCRVHVI